MQHVNRWCKLRQKAKVGSVDTVGTPIWFLRTTSAVNRPSPAEAVEKVSVRLEEVQHAIPGAGYENIWNFSILQLQPLQILIWEFDGTGLEKRACEAASQSDTWCTEGPRIVWSRLGSRPAKIRPRDLAGVLPEH
jgi:hypothetical protein